MPLIASRAGGSVGGFGGLGVSSIAAYAPTGSMFHIASTTLSTATATISFTSIPADYTHLQIRAIGRSAASNDYNVNMKINSDTGSNYAYHRLRGDGASASAQAGSSLSYGFVSAFLPLNSQTANAFGCTVIDILDYTNTNKYKTIRAFNGRDVNGSGGEIDLASCLWQSTSAITRLDFTGASADNFDTYTSFALYGVK